MSFLRGRAIYLAHDCLDAVVHHRIQDLRIVIESALDPSPDFRHFGPIHDGSNPIKATNST